MFPLFFTLISSIINEKPYTPDIKVGIIRKPQECKRIVTETSIVYCYLTAKVEGQALPIIDTRISGNKIKIQMNSQRVIPGFIKGLEGACLGEIRKIIIPPGLAYGEQYVDGLFTPDSTWIVEVEVLEIIEAGSV